MAACKVSNPENTVSGRVILRTLSQSEGQLQGIDKTPFTPAALAVLKEQVNSHIIDLIAESIRLAKRQNVDLVSPVHVERASRYLVGRPTRRSVRLLGLLGATFLGASVSTLLGAIGSAGAQPVLIVVASVVGIVGALLVGLHIENE